MSEGSGYSKPSESQARCWESSLRGGFHRPRRPQVARRSRPHPHSRGPSCHRRGLPSLTRPRGPSRENPDVSPPAPNRARHVTGEGSQAGPGRRKNSTTTRMQSRDGVWGRSHSTRARRGLPACETGSPLRHMGGMQNKLCAEGPRKHVTSTASGEEESRLSGARENFRPSSTSSGGTIAVEHGAVGLRGATQVTARSCILRTRTPTD